MLSFFLFCRDQFLCLRICELYFQSFQFTESLKMWRFLVLSVLSALIKVVQLILNKIQWKFWGLCLQKAHYHSEILQLTYKLIFEKDTSKLQLMSDSKERNNLLLCWNNFYIQLFSRLVILCKYENASIMTSTLSLPFICSYKPWDSMAVPRTRLFQSAV